MLDLGQTLSLLANAGVIAGLLLLAVQIRQSNDLIAEEITRSRAESGSGDVSELQRRVGRSHQLTVNRQTCAFDGE